MGRIIGIDLGTTYSALAVLEDKKPKIIPMKNGRKSMPSVVSFTADEVLAGESALKPETAKDCIRRIKRKMGTDIRIKKYDREYSPEEISAYILKELKMNAEEYLGEEVKDAIITVPAYFNDNQRQATKNAGKIAGLNVLRIINEPTAASLAYGVNPSDDMNIIVYDLGGGTFDISVLNVGEGVFEVISTAGDNNLGGEDFTQRILDLILARFKDETGIDLTGDPLAHAKLYTEVERAKIELSSKTSSRIQIPFITADETGAKDIDFEISRTEFEALIKDYIDRTVELTRQAVTDAHLELKEINRVLLVGGSSRIPMVQQKVEELFGRKPDTGLNPEEVVAMGAAIQGGIVVGDVSGIVLVDVTPMSLGIEVENGYFVPIIERNTPIPTAAKRIFTTVTDSQRCVEVHILQGESMYSQNNISLGKFRLEGIRQAPKGDPRVEVTLELDVNGILNVTASDLDSETAQGITIVNNERLSEDELERMREIHLKNYEQEIRKRKKFTQVLKLKTKAENISSKIESSIPPAYRNNLVKEELKELMKAVNDAVLEIDLTKIESAIEGLEFIHNELKAGNYNSEKIA